MNESQGAKTRKSHLVSHSFRTSCKLHITKLPCCPISTVLVVCVSFTNDHLLTKTCLGLWKQYQQPNCFQVPHKDQISQQFLLHLPTAFWDTVLCVEGHSWMMM